MRGDQTKLKASKFITLFKYGGMKMKFLIVTAFGECEIKVKEAEANNLNELITTINNTQRSKMPYQIYSSRPFTFETLLYTNSVKIR